MLTGNKGEWSEIYTLLKIISDKKLFAGDSNLNKIESLIFPIIKILRDESNGTYEYAYESNLVIIKGNEEEFRIPITEFQEKAIFLLSKLKETTTSTFSIPEIEKFINSFDCSSLKAKSSVKSDIRIVIHDQRTGTTPELGFSIKSQLGKPPTLFNSSQASNFIFKIDGSIDDNEINFINSIKSGSKIQDRVRAILNKGYRLKFISTEGKILQNNLTLIDSLLPQIIAEILLIFNTTKLNKLEDLVHEIETKNPLDYDYSEKHKFYNYKVKRLLSDCALGMVSKTVWSGLLDSTGGYLIVKSNGEIICYHIYNRNQFEEYLLKNTKIINPSSKRNKYGIVYSENGQYYFKLNLQIRFLK
jgi:uncharacterized protein YjfI (DUF2170 family)